MLASMPLPHLGQEVHVGDLSATGGGKLEVAQVQNGAHHVDNLVHRVFGKLHGAKTFLFQGKSKVSF